MKNRDSLNYFNGLFLLRARGIELTSPFKSCVNIFADGIDPFTLRLTRGNYKYVSDNLDSKKECHLILMETNNIFSANIYFVENDNFMPHKILAILEHLNLLYEIEKFTNSFGETSHLIKIRDTSIAFKYTQERFYDSVIVVDIHTIPMTYYFISEGLITRLIEFWKITKTYLTPEEREALDLPKFVKKWRRASAKSRS